MPSDQAVHAFILDQNNSHQVVVYSKSNCSSCERVTNLFAAMRKADTDVAIVSLDQIRDGDLIENDLVAMTGQKTAPFIFVKGRHVSGKPNLRRPRTGAQAREHGEENTVPNHESPVTVRKEFYSIVSHNSASPWFM